MDSALLRILGVTLISVVAAGAQAATFLSPVAVASTGGYDTSSLTHMIDGSGLTTFDETGTHSDGAADEWQGLGESGTVSFDLGADSNIRGLYLWNQEVPNGAVDSFSLTLLDASSTPLLTVSGLNAQVGTPSGATPAELFSFAPTSGVRFVDLQVISLHASTSSPARTVIGEIGFLLVPEPATGLLSLVGLTVLALRRRRR